MEHAGEIWQELNFNGERLGGIEPNNHDPEKVKLYYGAAIMLYRFNNGEVEFLFQHRAKSLRGNPDKWDVSAGGHVNLGESAIEGAVRETREEIGAKLEKDNLEIAASFRRWNIFVSLYFYDWTDKKDEFHFDDKEVEEVKWIKYSELTAFWPKLKKFLAEDDIFKYYLKEWNKRACEKYANIQTE